MHAQIHSLLRHSSFSHEILPCSSDRFLKTPRWPGSAVPRHGVSSGCDDPRGSGSLAGPTGDLWAQPQLPLCKQLGPGPVLASGETQGQGWCWLEQRWGLGVCGDGCHKGNNLLVKALVNQPHSQSNKLCFQPRSSSVAMTHWCLVVEASHRELIKSPRGLVVPRCWVPHCSFPVCPGVTSPMACLPVWPAGGLLLGTGTDPAAQQETLQKWGEVRSLFCLHCLSFSAGNWSSQGVTDPANWTKSNPSSFGVVFWVAAAEQQELNPETPRGSAEPVPSLLLSREESRKQGVSGRSFWEVVVPVTKPQPSVAWDNPRHLCRQMREARPSPCSLSPLLHNLYFLFWDDKQRICLRTEIFFFPKYFFRKSNL